MFAYRWTWLVKHRRMNEALELSKAEQYPAYAEVRFYTPSIGPTVFVCEVVVENDEALAKFLADFNARPEAAAFWEKWHSLAERMVSSERWKVTKPG